MALLEQIEVKDYNAIADALSQELALAAVERNLRAGTPNQEIERLRQTGLLPLIVPKKYGGVGATWIETFKIVQKLSKADGSIGQLYGNHLNLVALGEVSVTPIQAEQYYQETAQKNL